MSRSDRELMVAYSKGDDQALAELYDRYERALVNFFFKMCYDRDQAEDLTHDTFVRIMRHRRKYKPKAAFRTFLYTVARNLWIDAYRSRKAAPRTVSTDRQTTEDGRSLLDLLPSAEDGVIKRVSDAEAARCVRDALEDLPDGQRMVFVMAEYQGLKYREIADILDVPEGTIKSRMHAAVKRLRGILGRTLS